jgi:hypothetical protein
MLAFSKVDRLAMLRKLINSFFEVLPEYAFYSKLSALRSLLSISHSFTFHKPKENIAYIIQLNIVNTRVDSDKKGVVHDEIRVRQLPRNAMGNVLICGVAQEIAAEEVSGLDAVGFQECGQVIAGKTGLIFHRDDITEPGGIVKERGSALVC